MSLDNNQTKKEVGTNMMTFPRKQIVIVFLLILAASVAYIGIILLAKRNNSPVTTDQSTLNQNKDQNALSKQNCIFSLRFDTGGKIDEALKVEAAKQIEKIRQELQTNHDGAKLIATIFATPDTKKKEVNPYSKFNPLYVPNLCFSTSEELQSKVSPVFMKINPNIQKLLAEKGPFISKVELIRATFGDGVKDYAYTIVYKN